MPMNMALKIAIVQSKRPQVEIAKAADIHESKLSQIVNGWREPSDTERKALARVLKREAAELFPNDKKRRLAS